MLSIKSLMIMMNR